MWGRRECGVNADGYKVYFWVNERVLKLCVVIHTSVSIQKPTKSHTLNEIIVWQGSILTAATLKGIVIERWSLLGWQLFHQ